MKKKEGEREIMIFSVDITTKYIEDYEFVKHIQQKQKREGLNSCKVCS